MKVYELMSTLVELPSGADVFCTACTCVNELEEGILMDDDSEDTNEWLYEISKPLDNVDKINDRVYLGF